MATNHTIAQLQSERIRNAHRLAEIKDAQVALDKLEADLKKAIGDVLGQHGLKMRDMTLDLALRSGKIPTFDGRTAPAGWFSGSMDVT